MSGAPQRTFSFNYHDEGALQPGGPGHQNLQSYQNEPPQVSPIDTQAPPLPPVHRNVPVGVHPGSAYGQMQPQRQYDAASSNSSSSISPPPDGQGMAPPRTMSIPRRPLRQSPPPAYNGGSSHYTSPTRSRPQSYVTPGADNLGEAAVGGGISGIAMGVANTNERDSGVNAYGDINGWGRNGNGIAGPGAMPQERSLNPSNTSLPYGYLGPDSAARRPIQAQASYSSQLPLTAGAYPPGAMSRSEHSSERSIPFDGRPTPPQSAYPYQDSPYNRYSSSHLDLGPGMGGINPNEIADDGEDDISYRPGGQNRKSFLPFGGRNSSRDGATAAGAGAGAAAGAFAALGNRNASGQYAAVPGGAGAGNPNGYNGVGAAEKSEWLKREKSGNKRRAWIVGGIIALVVIAAILGGVLGGVLNHKNDDNSANPSSPQAVANDNKDDLDINSSEIKGLMNNKNLHKVFPGMDYTPLNTQYPDCLNSPPSQNNVTRDIAVLSQLTNNIRLYGTDCNQTEMALHAIDKLQLTDMKIWLGVWLGNNDTTNSRQLAQMWSILDANGDKPFKGIIIGNEVLYRKDLTSTELTKILGDVKSNLTSKSIDLPVATSDLGDNWTADLASKVDIVMSNIHPFFAGVTAEEAAAWTWDFWQTHDVVLTSSSSDTKQVISEVGWPSAGGNDCGASDCTSDTQGSIAGIDEMNTFMNDFICQSLDNGTEYFWFEAFDEPWKIEFDTKGKDWEDKWGLMDVNRNLKSGVSIPDCGGKTAP